ncbi:MAG: hypothetical protein ACXVKK_12885, partial [Flavisolibacter sp.]
NWVRYAKVDANGNFSTNYILCNTSGTNLQVLGVDDGGQQQGNPTTLQVTAPTTDVGTVSACGTSSTQSINYSVDGTAYSISALDSLTAFTSGQGAQLTSYINGLRIGSNNSIWFKFDHPSAAAGTYPVITLSVQNYTSTTLVQPFNVVITNFPQVPGQFYEGNITGQFKDASNLTHNLTCTFRVRRTF